MNNQINVSNVDTESLILEEKIALYARVPHYVLITGERGTGKTTIARQLHEQSPRSKREFVSVNCASFTSELLESELFGYEKGAFTGAASAKAGLFETSGGGTLFLDEIGDLTLGLQAKLLKAVEEKRIRRVGGTFEREIDVRIVAATSRNLKEMVRHGAFRPDLFDRLNILQLETIPLRFQRERIRELFVKEMERQSETVGRTLPFEIDDAAVEAVQSLEWRGNYRELKNFAVRLAVEAMDETAITAELVIQMARDGWAGETTICSASEARSSDIWHEPRHTKQSLVMVTLDAETDDLDTVYVKAAATFIEHALKQSNGNLRRAARSMNTTHSTLSRILKKNNERKARIDVSSNSLTLSAAA